MKVISTSLIALLLVGCHNGSHSSDDTPEGIDLNPSNQGTRSEVDPSEEAQLKITEALGILENIDCENTPDNEMCADINVAFKTKEVRDKDVVVILEEDFPLYDVTARYSERTLAVFGMNENGAYVEHEPSIEIPKYLKDILEIIQEDFISATHLSPILDELSEVFVDSMESLYGISHSHPVFSYIAEHNPHHDLIIAPHFVFSSYNNYFCNKDYNKLSEIIETASITFKENVLDKYNVKYLNLSAGFDYSSFQRTWSHNCSGSVNYNDFENFVEIIKPYYNVLFNTPNVIGIQAAAYSPTLENAPLDCDKEYFQNRIRVGFFESLDSGLDENGRLLEGYEAPTLKDNQQGPYQCIDMFLNLGIICRRPFPYGDTPMMITDTLGLSEVPSSLAGSSWAAPLATSFIINYLTSLNTENLPLPNDGHQIIDQIITDGCDWQDNGMCRMLDPLRYYQLNVFDYNYK